MKDAVIVVSNDGLGHAEEGLRRRVATTYFTTLHENGSHPKAIVFYTAGVKLCCTGSGSIDSLKALAAAGVQLIVCRTCLDHFGLLNEVAVGDIGNMLQIIELQDGATKVITV